MDLNLAHIGVYVCDLERSVRFYQDVLDFVQIFRIKPLRWLHQPVRVERGEIDRVGEMEESGVGRGETEAV